MKGLVKVIIAGVVLLVVGVTIVLVALGVNGWKIDGKYEMKTYECVEDNNNLNIDFSVGMLEINYYDGEKIKIEYPENKDLSATIEEKDGSLSFETVNKRKWFQWLNLSWIKKIPATKIWIPQDDIMNVKLDMNAGTVKFADGEYGNFEVNMNAGTFSMGDTVCQKLSIELNAGTINLKSVESAEKVEIDLSAGTTNIGSLVCPSVECSVSAGSVNINRLQSSITDVDVSAGTVKLTMAGAKADYYVSVNKSAGSCNISNQTGAKDLKIKADISAGTLNVKFES